MKKTKKSKNSISRKNIFIVLSLVFFLALIVLGVILFQEKSSSSNTYTYYNPQSLERMLGFSPLNPVPIFSSIHVYVYEWDSLEKEYNDKGELVKATKIFEDGVSKDYDVFFNDNGDIDMFQRYYLSGDEKAGQPLQSIKFNYFDDGKLLSEVYSGYEKGLDVVYAYDSEGRLASESRFDNRKYVSYFYGDNGMLSSIKEYEDFAIDFLYPETTGGRKALESSRDPQVINEIEYTYREDGTLFKITPYKLRYTNKNSKLDRKLKDRRVVGYEKVYHHSGLLWKKLHYNYDRYGDPVVREEIINP